MQEPGSRTAPPFAGVDLRRPKGYPALAPAEGEACPRCESRDTKFCYYNNYNTTQPRHYCRSCRRYWTKGGSLRNVPVGGASRNNTTSSPPKRTKTSNSKRRRVVPEPEHEPVGTDASAPAAAGRAATATTEAVATEDAAADDLAGPPAVDTEPSVKLGVGLADAGGKEPSPFEWPSGCDDLQGISYWGTGVLADADPAMFLNLP